MLEIAGSNKALRTSLVALDSHPVRVICRVRPALDHEGKDRCVDVTTNTVQMVNHRNPTESIKYE